jgi:hypothetical protein
MSSRLYHSVELNGLSGLVVMFGRVSGWLENSASNYLRSRLFRSRFFKSPYGLLPVAALAGLGAWMLLAGDGSKPADHHTVPMPTAVAAEPAPSPAPDSSPAGWSSNPPTAPAEAIVPAPVEVAPVDRLRISSQFWRRGGLGSNALVTFTLRNRNDFAVKDVEISCAFSRRDGTHLTDRTRLIHDTVNRKSRKIFARMHIGYVNINAERAKCSLVAASHA